MATDPSLAPSASFASAEGSGADDAAAMAGEASSEVAMALPDTVTVLPTESGHTVEVAYAEPSALRAASFAGPQPLDVKSGPFPPAPQVAVPALKAPVDDVVGEEMFVRPLPVALSPRTRPFQLPEVSGGSEEINALIEKYAELYDVPLQLVRRVVRRESHFNPSAVNRGHWGLMQIKHATARGMGYRGTPQGLLDAETNLKYAVRYLRGAWLVAQGNPDLADRLYQSGYYYHAKRMGLLDETGLGRDRVRRRLETL